MKNPIIPMQNAETENEKKEELVEQKGVKTWIKNNWKKVAKTAALVGAGVVGTLVVMRGRGSDDDGWTDTDETQYPEDEGSETEE